MGIFEIGSYLYIGVVLGSLHYGFRALYAIAHPLGCAHIIDVVSLYLGTAVRYAQRETLFSLRVCMVVRERSFREREREGGVEEVDVFRFDGKSERISFPETEFLLFPRIVLLINAFPFTVHAWMIGATCTAHRRELVCFDLATG